jgi:hypothetical protein
MKTKVFQYYNRYHFSCECGLTTAKGTGYVSEEGARKGAELHTRKYHSDPMQAETAKAQRYATFPMYINDFAAELAELTGGGS